MGYNNSFYNMNGKTVSNEKLLKIFDPIDKIIRGKYYFKAAKSHIFMNWKQFNVSNLEFVREGDKVHIFIDELLDPFYGDDNIFEFVSSAEAITSNKVIIHIPYYAKEIKYSLEAKLDGLPYSYKVMIDHLNTSFKFRENVLTDMDHYLFILVQAYKSVDNKTIKEIRASAYTTKYAQYFIPSNEIGGI